MNKIVKNDRKSVDRLHNGRGDKEGVPQILNQGREGWIIDMSTCQRSPSSKPKGKGGSVANFLHSCLVAVSTSVADRLNTLESTRLILEMHELKSHLTRCMNSKRERERWNYSINKTWAAQSQLYHFNARPPSSYHALHLVYAALPPNTVTTVKAFIRSYKV